MPNHGTTHNVAKDCPTEIICFFFVARTIAKPLISNGLSDGSWHTRCCSPHRGLDGAIT